MSTKTVEGLQRITEFVRRRHQVYVNRAAGLPKPWTQDPILQAYRFCNVYRELDTVTQWVAQHWRQPSRRQEDNWFFMVIARLVNNPDTLAHISGSVWYAKDFIAVLDKRMAGGHKAFGSAYIVSTNGRQMPKPLYLAEQVLEPLWAKRDHYRPVSSDTLHTFHHRLSQAMGLGSFMAAQVVADVKNTKGGPLAGAMDWYTWAAPGPGSLRGLARVVNGDHEKPVPGKEFLERLGVVRHWINQMAKKQGWEPLCAQDVQNCLCEFDKYERVRLGQGKPRQGYPGRA